MASHFWFIWTERGTLLHHVQTCQSCWVKFECQPVKFRAFSKKVGPSIDRLVEMTFPNLPTIYAGRLAVTEAKGVDPAAREALLRQAFALAEPHFQYGTGGEGRRILTLALKPLQPTEDEIRNCLQRYRHGRSRMGARVRTAEVMAAVYPESVVVKPGSFDY